MGFPITRLRRLRTSPAMRRLVGETGLSPVDFVYPLFACPGQNIREPIESMTGCYHLSPEGIAAEAAEAAALGIPAILLFGLPEGKDAIGSDAWAPDSAVCQSIRRIKELVPQMLVITDVCLCAYTDHGHCGVVKDGRIDNDSTLELLARIAVAHAHAGADIVAPSDMMDGRVGAIRKTLDVEGFLKYYGMSLN